MPGVLSGQHPVSEVQATRSELPTEEPLHWAGGLSRGGTLGLQRSIGNRAVASLLAIQRTRVKPLQPAGGGLFGIFRSSPNATDVKAERTTALRLLYAQLAQMAKGADRDVLEAEVARLLKLPDPPLTEVNSLIARVGVATPQATGAAPSAPTAVNAKDPGASNAFAAGVATAKSRITTGEANDVVLADTFCGVETEQSKKDGGRDQAKQTFVEATAILDQWDKDVTTPGGAMVRVNQNPADYGGFAQKKQLMLGKALLADAGKLPDVLIHEATHAADRTLDHAYLGAPYFLGLPAALATRNADHYVFAIQVAKGELALPGKVGGLGPKEARARKAMDLAYFTANRVWTFSQYLKSTYEGSHFADPRLLHAHGRLLGFDDPGKGANGDRGTEYAYNKSIGVGVRTEHAHTLAQVFGQVKSFTTSSPTFAAQSSGEVEVTGGGNWSRFKISIPVTGSVPKDADLVIRALLEKFGMKKELDLAGAGAMLIDHFLGNEEDTHHTELRYSEDKAVLSLLSS